MSPVPIAGQPPKPAGPVPVVVTQSPALPALEPDALWTSTHWSSWWTEARQDSEKVQSVEANEVMQVQCTQGLGGVHGLIFH